MTSTLLYPPLVDVYGNPVDPRSDDYIEGIDLESKTEPANQTYATAKLPPLGWNHGKPDGSRQVGWTLQRRGSTQIVEQHAFSINPQSITRTDSTRTQLFATQAGFYVDDFGPGPVTIQITQLVAHGRQYANGGGSLSRATMRQDVLRFYDRIYTKAVANRGQYQVYFHDNHLWDVVSSRSPEKVYFPPQAFQLVRSTSLHNVWQLQLTMVTLDAPPPATSGVQGPTPGLPRVKVYVVQNGDTLKKIATKLAGRNNTHKRVLQLEQQIVALTKKYGKDDITKNRTVQIYSGGNRVGQTNVTRMHVAPGEKIILPAG